MTNLNFKRFTGVALLLLGFSACNNELSEPQYSEPSQSAHPKTEQIYLDIITNGSEEMRLAQKVDGSGATTGVFLEEKDLAIQIGVRRKGQAQVATQLLRFQKIKGAPRARYTGLVNVPTGSGNEVEIAGIVLGEWTGDSKTEPQPSDVKFMTKSGSDFFQSIKPEHLLLSKSGVVRTKIPYIVDWTTAKLTVPEGGKQRIEPVTLYFKPNGTILRLQLLNSQTQKVKITQIKVKTNAFVEQWQYNFANGLVQENKLMGGELLSGTLPLEEQNYTWTLEQPITLNAASNASNAEPTKSQWLYTWVMGTKSFVGPRKIEFTLQGEGSTTYSAVFKTSAALKDGQTMWIPLTVSSSKVGADFGSAADGPLGEEAVFTNPLAHLVTTDGVNKYAMVVKGTGAPFTLVDPSQVSGISEPIYYTYAEAMASFQNGIEVSGKKYGLPTIHELGTIFPTQVATNLDHQVYNFTNTALKTVQESVQFIGEQDLTTVTSHYKGSDDGTLYGLRFDNVPSKKMAFRYSHANGYVKVTARYLGEQPSPDMNVLATPEYWSSNNVGDMEVSFRLLGFQNTPNTFSRFGHYWSSTDTSGRARYLYLSSGAVNGFSHVGVSSDYRFTVILVPRD